MKRLTVEKKACGRHGCYRTFGTTATRMVLCAALIACMSCFVTGCGESIEVRQEKAKLSLNSGNASAAVTLAKSIVAEQPGNIEGWMMLAQGHFMLNQLAESNAALDQLILKDPNHLEAHRLRHQCALRRGYALIDSTGFGLDGRSLDAFVVVARAESDWVAAKGLAGEAALMKAAEADLRMAAVRKQTQAVTSRSVGKHGREAEEDRKLIEELDHSLRELWKDAETQHSKAIALLPAEEHPVLRQLELLMGRNAWKEAMALLESLSKRTSMSPAMSEYLMLVLTRMPAETAERDRRAALADRLMALSGLNEAKTPQAAMIRARVAMIRGNAKEAAALARQALGTSEEAEAVLLASAALLDLGDAAAAETLVKDWLDKRRSSNDPLTRYRGKLAHSECLRQLGRVQDAIGVLREAIEIAPDAAPARLMLCQILLEYRGPAAAGVDIRALYQAYPDAPEHAALYLTLLHHERDTANFDDVLRRLDRADSPTIAQMLVLAHGYLLKGDHDRARAIASRVIERDNTFRPAYVLKARAMLAGGDRTGARELMDDMLKKFPGDSSVLALHGRTLLQWGAADQSIEQFEQILAANPTDSATRILLANALAAAGLTSEALAQVNQALERSPDDREGHILAWRLQTLAGHETAAAKHLAALKNDRQLEAQAPAMVAAMRLAAGDRAGAEEVCTRALQNNPNDASLRWMLARIFADAAPAKALDQITLLISEHPNRLEPYVALARHYLKQKQPDEGLAQLQKLETINPLPARYARCVLLDEAGRGPEGYLLLRSSVPVKAPASADVTHAFARRLVDLDRRRGKPADSLPILDQLAEVKRLSPALSLMHAEITASVNPSRANTMYQALANATAATDRVMIPQIVESWLARGYPADVIAAIDRWLSTRPGDASLTRLKSIALRAAGRTDDAAAMLDAAIKSNPADLPLHVEAIRVHSARADYVNAELVSRQLAAQGPTARIVALAEQSRMLLDLGLTVVAEKALLALEQSARKDDPRILLLVGDGLASMGKHDEAAARLNRVPHEAEEYPAARAVLARIHRRTGKAPEARDVWMALARDANVMPALSALLAADAADMAPTEVTQLASTALAALGDDARSPQTWRWRLLSVDAHLRQGDWPSADAALTIMPWNDLPPPAQATGVLLAMRLGNMEEARRRLLVSPALNRGDEATLLRLAMGDSVPAAALNAQPPAVVVLAAAARGERVELDRIAGARWSPPFFVSDVKRVATVTADESSRRRAAALLAAAASLRFRQQGMALAWCDDAIAAGGKGDAMAQAFRLIAAGETPDARRKTLAAGTELADTALLAYVQMLDERAAGKGDAAIAAARTLLSRDPSPVARLMLAQQLDQSGQREEAIAAYKQVLAGGGPLAAAAANNLAYLLATGQSPNLAEATTIVEQAIASGSPSALDTAAWIAHLKGDHARAIALFSRAAQGLKSDHAFHYRFGTAYAAAGNALWARYHLAQASQGDPKAAETAAAVKALELLQ